MTIFLLAAGQATTTHLIGSGMLALLENRQELNKLRDDPTLIDAAVEEMLRFNSPIQRTGRVMVDEIELYEHVIPRGGKVRLMIGEANRDPGRFNDPNIFMIERPGNKHVGFGSGIHQCLGLHLARMETKIAVGALVHRFPNMIGAAGPHQWVKGTKFKGLKSLRVSV